MLSNLRVIAVVAVCLLLPTELYSRATLFPQGKPLTNDDVLLMVEADFGEETIIEAIRSNEPGFDTSAEALVALKNSGVSEKIIMAILARARPRTGPSVPSSTSDGLPEEMGIYVLQDNIYVPLPLESVEWRSGFFSGTTTRGSLKTTQLNARLPTLNSPLELSGSPELLVVCPEGVSPIEYHLTRARDEKDKREFRVEFQVLSGDLWVARGGTGEEKVEFEAEQLGVRKFKLKLPPLEEGEYAFLPPTTGANKSTLSVARMYTFRMGIDF